MVIVVLAAFVHGGFTLGLVSELAVRAAARRDRAKISVSGAQRPFLLEELMRHVIAGIVITALTSLAACSREESPGAAAAAPKPAASGIDASSIDKTVRPQDDLFRYVNGAWLATTEIPADKSSYGALDILIDKAQEDLRAIVEDASKNAGKAPGSEAQKIGDFYESFMNEARADEIRLTPLEPELAAIDGIATKSDLARYFARMFKLNLINPLLGYVEGDAKQPDHDILYVFQSGLGLPDRDYYIKDDPTLKGYREKYLGFLETVLRLGNSGHPRAPQSRSTPSKHGWPAHIGRMSRAATS